MSMNTMSIVLNTKHSVIILQCVRHRRDIISRKQHNIKHKSINVLQLSTLPMLVIMNYRGLAIVVLMLPNNIVVNVLMIVNVHEVIIALQHMPAMTQHY